MHELLLIKGFRRYLAAYICVFIKWAFIKHTLYEQDGIGYDSNNRKYQFVGNFIQILIGYFIAQRLHGRRMKLIFIMLAICFVSDVCLDVFRIATDDDINDNKPWED